jgi:hypothetical protein
MAMRALVHVAVQGGVEVVLYQRPEKLRHFHLAVAEDDRVLDLVASALIRSRSTARLSQGLAPDLTNAA